MATPPQAAIDFWDPPPDGAPKGGQNAGAVVLYGEGPAFSDNPWDVIFFNSQPVPGICKVKSKQKYLFDKKKPGGSNGLTVTGQGYLPGPVTIEVMLWTQEQWEFFQAIADSIWVKPVRGGTIRPIDVSHPGLDLWRIKAIVIEGVSVPEEGPVPQSKIINIEAVQFLPPSTKTRTATPKSSGAIPSQPELQMKGGPKNGHGGKSPGETDTGPRGPAKDTSPGSK